MTDSSLKHYLLKVLLSINRPHGILIYIAECIIRKSNFPPNPKRSVRKSSFHIKRSVLKTINAQHQKCNQKKVAFLVSTNRLKQALKWHSNISRKPLLSQQKCVSLFSVKPPYYRKFHPAFYTTLCLCTWQNSSCAH